MGSSAEARDRVPVVFQYHSLRSVVSPEDSAAGRRRYCGVAPATSLFGLPTDENVRRFLGKDEDDKKRKSTQVNKAIRETLIENRDHFAVLNGGIVIVARAADVDDKQKSLSLRQCSIINGAQTVGVLKEFQQNPPSELADDDFDDAKQPVLPSVHFEVIITDDEGLIADITVARNFQNAVQDISIYGTKKLFHALEEEMQKYDASIKLRMSETDFSEEFLDTAKLVQVMTVLAPSDVPLPSTFARNNRKQESPYRTYAYSSRARCLKDFATVMSDEDSPDYPKDAKKNARKYFLETCWDAWQEYKRLKSEQDFSSLRKVEGEQQAGRKIVADDGVPDGIVFPVLSALSLFVSLRNGKWRLAIPSKFPRSALHHIAKKTFMSAASHNPQTMGKKAECYETMHSAMEMFLATRDIE